MRLMGGNVRLFIAASDHHKLHCLIADSVDVEFMGLDLWSRVFP